MAAYDAGPRAGTRRLGCNISDAVLVITAVALARLYRGAHFLTDVVGSVLFAVPWLLVTLELLRPRAGPQSGRRQAATNRHTSPHHEPAGHAEVPELIGAGIVEVFAVVPVAERAAGFPAVGQLLACVLNQIPAPVLFFG